MVAEAGALTRSLPSRSPKERALDWSEWLIAIILSATVLFLLAIRVFHAGGLWRDECDSVNLAQLPRFSDILANLKHSSFPILFTIILRSYIGLFGASDFALRSFGFMIGAAFLAAAWFHSLFVTRQPPLLLLTLIGLSSNFLTTAIWIRGYGIGAVFMIFTFISTAKLLQQFTTARQTGMLLISIAATQCLFFDGALMPGILFAALVVLLLHRQFRAAWLLVSVGLIIGLGCLTYSQHALHLFGIYLNQGTPNFRQEEPFSLSTVWMEVTVALGQPSFVMLSAWLAVVFGSVLGTVRRLKVLSNEGRTTERDMLLFALLVIIASISLQWGFVWILHRPPLPRYFTAFFCLLGSASDLALANLCRLGWMRLVRVAAVSVGMIALPFAVWPTMIERDTNIDILADKLEKEAGLNDLILVNTWSRGISFNRYYHGSTRWLTIPNIEDHRFHRYDLFQAKMTEFFPLDDLDQAITTTLKSGNRVWVVNDSQGSLNVDRPLVLAPAPDPKYGWRELMYSYSWSQQVFHFLRVHSREIGVIVQRPAGVSRNESAFLVLAQGWGD